jgi:hypothetical protein
MGLAHEALEKQENVNAGRRDRAQLIFMVEYPAPLAGMNSFEKIIRLMCSIFRKCNRHHHARENQKYQYLDDDSAKDFDIQKLTDSRDGKEI